MDETTTQAPLTPVSVSEVKSIVEKLQELGAFLNGSRDRFQNFDYADIGTDWDFAVDKKDQPSLFNVSTLLGEYVEQEFNYDPIENGKYKDQQFIALYKHKTYPHITIVVKNDLELYKQVWKKLPMWYWHDYLWKSHPDLKKNFEINPEDKEIWYNFSRNTWDMLNEVCKIKSIKEFM